MCGDGWGVTLPPTPEIEGLLYSDLSPNLICRDGWDFSLLVCWILYAMLWTSIPSGEIGLWSHIQR